MSHPPAALRATCPGPVPRRAFLRMGLAGLASLTLPGLLRLRAQAGLASPRERTAVIVVWLRGGASHLETYDPKPAASSDFRGPYRPISTRVPSLQICELLPRHAEIADRFTILRSMAHTGGGHPAGSLQLLGGDPDPADKQRPVYPDFLSVAHYLRSDPDATRSLPNYVGVNGISTYDGFQIAGPGYLGPAYEPFMVGGDPNDPRFEIPNLGPKQPEEAERLRTRIGLRQRFDRLRRHLDQADAMQAIDAFEAQALNLLLGPKAREAFDLSREDPRVRDRYGRHAWGQRCLMARRLVEAGVELITTTFDGPLCGRVQNWDDHAVNHNVFEATKYRAPFFDQAVSALIEDIYLRGLDKRVLVVVTGEFGRTPRISYVASSGGGVASATQGVVQPGRDHWPNANSMLFAGGGISTGQVIGATDRRGEEVVSRRVKPADFLLTVYRHLGVDPDRIPDKNVSGRPPLILSQGKVIPELVGGS
ncbi:MAG: DUF1501 domain-containing protein [Planctomycetes bacterium]|nr:DUF1501 domain-containing protein [Planctomycetota bacterium]